MMRRKHEPTRLATVAVLVALVPACAYIRNRAVATGPTDDPLRSVQHFVVIYLENRSFDNIWGLWPGVEGLAANPAETANHVQLDAKGTPYTCLPQNDPNLAAVTAKPGSGGCAFPNVPFPIDRYIDGSAQTCWYPGLDLHAAEAGIKHPNGIRGGCTRDLVHRFYQEQFQIHGGRMDRFTLGSNAQGLTLGYYDTRKLPLYRYLTGKSAPPYVILDHFFAGAFGGSFLNHIWLISGRTPEWPGGPADAHSEVLEDGSVNKDKERVPLTHPAAADGRCLTSPGQAGPPPNTVCGSYVVNNIQPSFHPFRPLTPGPKRLPPLDGSHPTIGDALDRAKIGWAWYAGGWDNATGNTTGRGWTNGHDGRCKRERLHAGAQYPNCPDALFQFHHQPFNYFAHYGPGTEGRAHLKDEADFRADLQAGRLPAVAFVKPLGKETEHPGYTNLGRGEDHLVEIIEAIQADTADWPTTAIIITYDENGGFWDHVSPPTGAGMADRWGPGTRVPAMIISPLLGKHGAVDQTAYDTTSILTTIEKRFDLDGRLSPRPGVPDLGNAFRVGSGPAEPRETVTRPAAPSPD